MSNVATRERMTNNCSRYAVQKLRNIISIVALAVLFSANSLQAGSHTWSGAVNGNWSTAGNWSSGGVPVLGEASLSLVFPAGATRTVMTNNIGALTVNAMNFGGSNYILRGASTITFGSSLINVLCGGDSNVIESTLNLPAGFVVSVSDNREMAFHTLTGAGYLVKFGAGEVHLRGAASNPLSGGYTINVGTLRLAKTGFATAVNGPLTIVGTTNFGEYASVWLDGDDQISGNSDVVVHPTGIFRYNGFTNRINNLTLMAGSLMGSGLLVLNGDLTLSAIDNSFPTPDISPLVQGNIAFSGPGNTIMVSNAVCEVVANIVENGGGTAISKTGPGTLWLKGGGNFAGALNIQAGTVRADQNLSLGSATGVTTVSSGASLILGAGLVTSESLGLSGDGVNGQGALQVSAGVVECYGNVTLSNTAAVRVNSPGELQLKGIISGPGGIKKLGDGELQLAGLNANSFAGPSFVNGGKLSLFKPANTRAIGSVTVSNTATLALEQTEQVDNAGVVSVHTGGAFLMANFNESIGGLNLGAGTVMDSGSATLTLLGDVYSGAPYSATNIPAVIKGNLSLGGATRNILSNGFDTQLVFDCAISDGAGTGGLWAHQVIFSLLRSNSFTGPVLLDTSYCSISNSFAFGAPGGGVISTNTGYSSGITFLNPSTSVSGETLTVGNNLFVGPRGDNAWNNPIIFTNSAQLFCDASGFLNAVLSLNGKISGNGNIWADLGILRLTQSNDYSGLTAADAGGTLVITHPNALGTTGQGTRVYEGGNLRLELADGAAINGEPLSFVVFYPSAVTNDWLTVAGAVSNIWNGVFVDDGEPARIGVEHASGVFVLNGPISGVGGLEKSGPGKLILTGTGANTFPGKTIVTNGVLRLAKSNGVQSVSSVAVYSNGRLEWGASEQMADAATLSLQGIPFSGITNALLGSHSETLTDLKMAYSRLYADSGTLTLLGSIDLTHNTIDSNFSRIHGTVRLGPGEHAVFSTVTNIYVGANELNLAGSVHEMAGSASLNVSNCNLVLQGSNSFTGSLIVNGNPRGAILTVRHPNALGGTAQGTLLTNSAVIDLAMPNGSVVVGESLVLGNARPGAYQPCVLAMYGEYTNTWVGPVTLLDTNLIQVTWGSKLTIDGSVTGPASMYSVSSGELVLTGAQPNTVNDLVSETGILRLAKPSGVPAFLGNLVVNRDDAYVLAAQVILEASGQFTPQTIVNVGNANTNAIVNLNGHAATIRRLVGRGTVEIGTGVLTISNSVSQYTDFSGRLQSAPGGMLLHQGLGTQRGGTFLLYGAAWLQSGTMYFDSGFIDGGLSLNAGATMDMYSPAALFGSLSGAGKVITSSGIIYVGGNDASTTFSGVIEGAGATNIVKIGTGTLTLAGTSTHAGKMVVWGGTLLANGTLAGPVHVERNFGAASATLGGTGVVQNVMANGVGAWLSPGATAGSPSHGRLRLNNLTMTGGSLYRCEVGGTNAGVNLDQIAASGMVTLTSANLDVQISGGGAVSNRYTVLKSTPAIAGTFIGKSEGSTFIPGAGRSMQITYVGGASGHDIVLTDLVVPQAGSINGIQRMPDGTIQLGGQGAPGALYEVRANTNLNTTNWILIGTVTANLNGAFSFVDTNAPSLPMRFYKFVLP